MHLFSFCSSIIGLLIGTLIAFNVIIGDLVPSIFHNLSGVEVRGYLLKIITPKSHKKIKNLQY